MKNKSGLCQSDLDRKLRHWRRSVRVQHFTFWRLSRDMVLLLLIMFWSVFASQNLVASELVPKIDDAISYSRDIRPILAEHCYACHGPDASSREAELRLDLKESAINSSDAVIKPGHPESSMFVKRIFSADSDFQMPPPEFKKQLTQEQKRLLQKWIKQGSRFEQHWSFQKPNQPSIPSVKDLRWPKNSIDHFVLDQLESRGVSPSEAADKTTLIRRVSLDLTGLPPTPEQVDRFLNDSRANAYEHLVDRLMGSVEYAERRAQDWLDLARYADTRGFADDQRREIWPYRDWVIRSIHNNMPFDQFTIEQLAGDLLPDANDEQILATAFHRNAPQAKGQTYPVEEYRIKGVIDRVNTTGKVWLGLSFECAECHDHKFDPITQRDYYAMIAIFNQIEHSGRGFKQGGPTMRYRIPSTSRGELLKKRESLRKQLAIAKSELPPAGKMDDKFVIGEWNKPTVVENSLANDLTGSLTISAIIQTDQKYVNLVSNYDWRGKQRGFVFGIGGEGEPEATPGHLFFWASSKADPFQGITAYGSEAINDNKPHHVAVEFVAGRSIRLFVDGVEDKSVVVNGNAPKSIYKSDRKLAIGAGYRNSSEPTAYRYQGSNLKVRLSNRALGNRISVGAAGKKVQTIVHELKKLESKLQGESREVNVPVMKERTSPRETFVHIRGNFLQKGEQVKPAIPAVLQSGVRKNSVNRLSLARWLVNGNNPLVSRVVVNRYWQSYFGQGLVRTPGDFGAHGASPTHPGLLDWLATEFVNKKWDRKHIHRMIVTSATYRQSSRTNEAVNSQDPQNVWLSYFPRIRLPAEQLRDQALFVSGLLVTKTGGPPVFPMQPNGYWNRRALPGNWKTSTGSDRYRRSIYTYWRRMALHPTLETLNSPARDVCVVQREISNTPNQALVLLNDPIFHESAIALSKRLNRNKGQKERKKINTAFRLVLGRAANADESEQFEKFLSQQRRRLKNDLRSQQLLAPNESPETKIDVAVWTLASSVLLNLDETVTRQ